MDSTTAAGIVTQVTDNFGYASDIVLAAGGALLAIAFLAYVFRKAKSAASGRISG